MLHNIASTVPNWAKVNTGLTKMYRAEVLEKVPVVQHLRFGGVLGWRRHGDGEVMQSSGDGGDGGGEEEGAFKRERDESTVAPWALPSLSGSQPPTRQGSGSSTHSHHTGSTPPPLIPTTSNNTKVPSPKPFVPPALFPSPRRKSRLSFSSHAAGTGTGEETVGSEGGAAASSSPFGVLSKPSLASASGKLWKRNVLFYLSDGVRMRVSNTISKGKFPHHSP
ncbi:hypothetical protein P7C70_g7356, partial [Phenoliferia sp. Uapishka_3]